MSVFMIRQSSGLRLVALPLLLVAAFSQVQPATPIKTELRSAMRKLWEHHITWIRLFIDRRRSGCRRAIEIEGHAVKKPEAEVCAKM